jgi:two-component system, sensor histidine kinase
LSKLKRLIKNLGFSDQETLVEHRLLKVTSLIISILVIPVIVANHFLGLPIILNIILAMISIIYATIFYYSYQREITLSVKLWFFGVGYISFVPLWFLNGGMMGSIYPFYFVMFFMGSIIFEAKHQIGFVISLLFHLSLILFLEFLFPEWLFEYASLENKKVDMIVTMYVAFITLSILLVIFRLAYDRDRVKLLNTQQILDKSNLMLEEAKEVAVNASQAKSNFLAQMSHELRTPLNTITGAADLLSKGALDKEQLEFVKLMKESSSVLLNIISDILDLSKVDASKVELFEASVDFSELLENMSKFAQFKIVESEKNIDFKLEVSDDFPKYLKLDEVRVRQIIINLISNALKYTENGVIKLKAEVEYSGDKEFIKIALIDTGIGIEKGLIEKILQPFFQVDGSKKSSAKGVGLGLAICKGLIDIMGGELSIKSSIGEGSTFEFLIPMKVATYREINKNFIPIPNEAQVLESTKVLLVEDNVVNQFILSKILLSMGVEPLIVNNGLEACEAVRNDKFDIILMDVQMPIMNGLEATKAILADPLVYPKPHIIAITANALKEDEQDCLKAGMNDFISKPVSFEKLRERIRHGLGVISTRI